MSVGIVYIALLVVGLVYACIMGALGWLADIGNGGDVHVDASGHLEAAHPHPLSGTTVATFVTGFGGGGILGHYLFEWPLAGSLAVAAAGGLALAAAAFGVLELIFTQTQAGAEFAVGEMVGRDAEVITAIPAGSAGEIAYVARGQRETAAARAVDGGSIPKGTVVTIERVLGPTVHVRAKGERG